MGAGRATDVTALEAVASEIAIHAKPGAILVEKSTVPCRTAELIQDTVSSDTLGKRIKTRTETLLLA